VRILRDAGENYPAWLAAIGGSEAPGLVKTLQKVPVLASFVGELLAMFFAPVKATGSADLVPEVQAVY